MALTDQQIKAKAIQLEQAGASEGEIETFVAAATAERGSAQARPVDPRVVAVESRGGFPVMPMDAQSAESTVLADDARTPKQMGRDARYAAGQGAAAGARALPLAAAMAFPPAGVAAFANLAAGAAASELAARGFEGKPQFDKEAMGEAAKNAVLFGTPAPEIAAARSFMGGVGQAAKGATVAAATQGLGEMARRSIEQGQIAGYDDMADAWKDMRAPLVFGATVGGVASKLKSVDAQRAADEARKSFLARRGIENPSLAMIRPDMAVLEGEAALRDPVLLEKIASANNDMVKKIYTYVGDKSTNAQMAAQMGPIVQRVDALNGAIGQARQEADAAKQALALAEKGATLPPEQMRAIRQKAQAALLNAANVQAAANYELKGMAGGIASPTDAANSLGGSVRDVIDARSAISAEKYGGFFEAASQAEGAAINAGTPLFAKDAILAKAKSALGHDATNATGMEILRGIRGAPAIEVPTGRMIEVEGEIVPEMREVFNKSQLDTLKAQMAKGFPQPQPGAANKEEATINRIYGSIVDDAHAQLAQRYENAPGVVAALDDAVKFYRTTEQIKDSKFGRIFLSGGAGGAERDVANLSAQTLMGEAQKMVNGDAQAITEFKRFVDALGNSNKAIQIGNQAVPTAEVQKLAMQSMKDAMKSALVAKNTTGGVVNYDGLLGDLENAPKLGPKAAPFPIENFGFGDEKTIRGWRGALKQFDAKDVTPAVVENALSNPEVRRVIENGAVDGGKQAIRNAMAETIFNVRANQAVALEAAGLTREARRAAADAQAFATNKNLTASQTIAAYENARANPLYSAFAGKGDYKWAQEASRDGEGTITHLLGTLPPESHGPLMKALTDHNPQLADVVKRRVLAQTIENEFVKLESAFKPSKNAQGEYEAGRVLDIGAIRDFFNPTREGASKLATLKSIVGPEAVADLKKELFGAVQFEDEMRKGGMLLGPKRNSIGMIVGASVTPRIGGVTGQMHLVRSLYEKAYDRLRRGYYNTVAASVLDKGLGNAIYENGGAVGEAVSSLPVQKAFLLLKDKKLAEELAQQDQQPNP
jgi:hypothetical protein